MWRPCPPQLGESKCDELDDTGEEVNLKLSLWQGSAEFESLAGSWRETHFEALDVALLEETINKWVPHVSCMHSWHRPLASEELLQHMRGRGTPGATPTLPTTPRTGIHPFTQAQH